MKATEWAAGLAPSDRKRWTGTETFHRDGKQHPAMEDGQLRTAKGRIRHLYPVMLAHSLLMVRMQQGRAYGWAHNVLTTMGPACRAVSRETLGRIIHWAVEQATTLGWNQQRLVTCLELAWDEVCKSPILYFEKSASATRGLCVCYVTPPERRKRPK